MRLAAAGALLLASLAWAHPQGFHERLTVTVAKRSLTALLVMDVDAGERCRLIRAGADDDRDGALSKGELPVLKAKLVSMAMKTLKLGVSSYALELTVKESKLSIREDLRVTETGLSIAVLLEVKFPKDVSPGMSLEVEVTSPDLSPVVVEVFQVGGQAPTRVEAEPGNKVRVRLGSLGEAPAATP